MPTTAAVIEHPKFGVVLWDTGINDAVVDPARADDYWGKGLPAAFRTHNFTRQHAVTSNWRSSAINRPTFVMSSTRICIWITLAACRTFRCDPHRPAG